MRPERVFMLFLFLCFTIPTLAQGDQKELDPDQPLRIEIPAKSDNETYRVIPCDSTGVVLFFKSMETVDEYRIRWYFSFYDKDLQYLWIKNIPILSSLDFRFSSFTNDTLTILFVNSGKNKVSDPAFQLLRIVPKQGTFILNSGVLPPNTEIRYFGTEKGSAWFGLKAKNEADQFFFINLNKGSKNKFSLGKGSYITLRWLSVDPEGISVRAVVSRQISKKSWEHYLVNYDSSGNIKNEILIHSGKTGYNFTNFQVIRKENGGELILGTYSLTPSATPGQKMKVPEESSGLFSCSIEKGRQKEVNFINYLELKNANNLLNEKDILSLKKKALKKNRNIGEYSLDLTMLLHKIVRYEDIYVLLGEIYYPQYRTENYTDFDFYGRPYSNSYSIFDGYRYTNAIVAAFDSEGKHRWDNSMEIRNLVSFELDPKVTLFPSGDEFILSYLSDGKIGSKIILENEVVEKLDYSPVDLLYPDDKLLAESRSRMVFWYDNYFLCYGYQEIKNIALEKNNTRLVFYLNKVRFER